MKEVTVQMFEAFDGARFSTAKKCRDHEEAHGTQRLSGLTVDQVEDAFTGRDPDLADAFERFGQMLARSRRKAGNLKRVRRVAEKVQA